MVNVELDVNSGDVSPAGEDGGNHYVMIFREGDQYYLNNTGVVNNGDDSAVTPISEAH